MTLEEAIAHAEQQAIRYEKEAKRKREYGGAFYDAEVQACLICAEQHRQLAEWLKELIERRKQPEIIYCKDCKYNVSSHKCLHPESFFLVPSNDFYCGYSKRRSDAVNNTKNKTREARWIINSDGYYPYCSACMTEPQNGEMTDYCPNCGAKMKK